MASLPPLEQDVILRDEASPAIASMTRLSNIMNQSLQTTDRALSSVSRSMKDLQRAGGTTGGVPALLGGDMGAAVVDFDSVIDRQEQIKRNMEILGSPPPSAAFDEKLASAKRMADDLASNIGEVREKTAAAATSGQRFASVLSSLDNTRLLRAIPGTEELAVVGDLARLLPGVNAGVLAVGGAFGVAALAAYGLYRGVTAAAAAQKELEVNQNFQNKLLPVFDEPAAQTIDKFRQSVQDRISNQEALTLLLKVDPTSALADIEKLGKVTETAQKFADAYGLNLNQTIAAVIDSIDNLDAKQLEQLGIVKSVDAAYQDYAATHGKLPEQLSKTEKQEALIQAVLEQNAKLAGEMETTAQQTITATDKVRAGWANAREGFSEWLTVMMSDDATGVTSFWNARLEELAGALDRFDANLRQKATDIRFAAEIPGDEQAKYQTIQARLAFLQATIDSNNARIPILASEGRQDTIAQIEAENARFAEEIATYTAAIKDAQDKFKQGLEVDLPDLSRTMPQSVIDKAVEVQQPTAAVLQRGLENKAAMEAEVTSLIAEQAALQQKIEEENFRTAGHVDQAYVESLTKKIDELQTKIEAYRQALAKIAADPATASLIDPSTVKAPPVPQADSRFPVTPPGTGTTTPADLIGADVNNKQVDAARIRLETQQVLATRYATAINDARSRIAETNERLARSESELNEIVALQAASSGEIVADLHTQRQSVTAELTDVTRSAQEGRAVIAQQQLLAQQTQLGPQINAAQQQSEVLKTFIDAMTAYGETQGDLNKIIIDGGQAVASSAQQAGNSVAQEGVTLNARAVEATSRVMEAYRALSQSGIQLAGTTAGDQLDSAWRMFEESQTKIAAYRLELESVQAQLDEVDGQIDKLNNTPVDALIAQGITDPAILQGVVSQLEARKSDLESQLSDIQRRIAEVPTVDPGAATAAQGMYEQARAAHELANARLGLLIAERDYIASYQALRTAAASGNDALVDQATASTASAEKAYLLALAQAKAAGATTDLQVAADEVPDSLDYVIQQLEKLRTTGDAQLSEWAKNSIDTLKKVEDAYAAAKVEPPTPGGIGGKGLSAPIPPEMQTQTANFEVVTNRVATAGRQAYSLFLPVIAETTDAVGANVQAMLEQSNATNASVAATQQLAGAQTVLAQANAINTALTAQTTQQYQVFLPVVQNSAGAMTDAAIARLRDAAAAGEQYQAMYSTTVAAGVLIDAISGLPLAFDSASTSGDMLDANLRSLVGSMNALEGAAISAGNSVAARLIPVMGIGGALRQGNEWQQQAAAVRDAFETNQAGRLARGESPLSTDTLEFGLRALQESWSAQASDMTAAFEGVGNSAGGMADKMEAAAKRMDDALNGIISGVLKDSTGGLIPLDSLLPREDAVDEDARRMADVAVKGFKSPWFEGLKGLFTEDQLAGGEEAVKQSAARMVRDHQQGLTTIFYNTDLAAQQVMKKIEAKKNMEGLIAEVRDKVKGMAEASDIDIMEALGIDTSEEKAAATGKRLAQSMALSFDQIVQSMLTAGQPGAVDPTAAGGTAAATTGTPDGKKGEETVLAPETEAAVKTQMDAMGEAMVTQADEGKYMERAIGTMLSKIADKKDDVKSGGKTLADWLGGEMLLNFSKEVPKGLLDILVTNLVPLMAGAMTAEKERESGAGANTGGNQP